MNEGARARVASFEDLEVFKRAYRLSLDVHRRSLTWPPIEQRALGDQARRASKSIVANIAEGYGRQKQSKAEFKRFSVDGGRFGRRDAGVGAVGARSWLSRRVDLARMARRVSDGCEDAAKPHGEALRLKADLQSSVVRRLSSVLRHGSGAFRLLTKGWP